MINDLGYVADQKACEILSELVTDTSAYILDAGCGTGLVGGRLRSAGYQNIDGSDFSTGMLAKAKDTNAYNNLFQHDLTKPLALKAPYEALIAVGVFGFNTPSFEHLGHLTDCLVLNGYAVVTVNGKAWDDNNWQKRINELLDIRRINDVLLEYCYALDQMDLARLAALFTDECVVNYGPDKTLQCRGSVALKKSLERMWRWSRTSHHLSNVMVAFDTEDDANVTSYVYAWHERDDGSTATVLGQYVDRFIRQGGTWKIAVRRMVMNGSDAGFTVNLNRIERNAPPAGWLAPKVDGEA